MIPVTFVAESNGHAWEAEVMALPREGDVVHIQPNGVKIGYAPGQSNYAWKVKHVVHIVHGERPIMRNHTIRIIVS